MHQSAEKRLRIPEPLHEESALANLVVEQFLLEHNNAASFRERVRQFDSFLHAKMLGQSSQPESTRFKIAHHSTDTELVIDYLEISKLAPIVSAAFSAIAHESGYIADIEQRAVMTIHGTAERFLITLNEHRPKFT